MKTINLEDIIDKYNGVIEESFIETDDPKWLEVLEEEKKKACLEHLEIKVLLAEPQYARDISPKYIADVMKMNDGTYEIRVYPVHMKRENYTIRGVIRHELAHIKYGDLDRKLPPILKRLYNLWIEEPRAKGYAKY